MKLLLTSAGFGNQAVAEAFAAMLGKPPAVAKVLFIPTAAQSEEALQCVEKCKKELLSAGIERYNIHVYDLDRRMEDGELRGYDAVYICGGDTRYLLKRVKRAGFDKALASYPGVYVGVSAGSLIMAARMDIGRGKMVKGLGSVTCGLRVHCQEGAREGKIEAGDCPVIALSDRQALIVEDNKMTLVQ
jgi:peptidase E